MTKDVKPSLIKVLELLQPYRSVAAGLRIFVESAYADEKIIQQLMDFIQSNLTAFRLSSINNNEEEAKTQDEEKRSKDLDEAEHLLRSLKPEGLEQNLDVNKDNAIEKTEIRDVLPHMTSKEWKKFAQTLSENSELQRTMKASCETIVADMTLKIKNGDKLTTEDIELFQLSVFILGKNTAITIDGVVTPGNITEQLIKEISPEYFIVSTMIERFGSECKINLNGLRKSLPAEVRNVVFEKLRGYKQRLVDAHVKEESQQNILYNVFAQGVNSRGKFDDAEWFADLNGRIAKVEKEVDAQAAEDKKREVFQQQQQKITKINKDKEGLMRQVMNLNIRIDIEQDAYQGIYNQLAEVLTANNSLREKIKTVSSYGLAAAASPIGPYIVGLRGKPTPDANELLQIELYTRLTQQFQVISNFQAKKKEVISTFDVRGLEQQCLYYESLRDIGSKDRAEQALVNLITEHGQPIRTKYASDIQKLKGTASGTTLAILNVDKPTLQTIVKEKQREIDIAQQVLSGAKAEWGGSTVGSLQHLSQEQIHRIIGNEGKQYARLTGSMVEVRDNTATQIKIQTQQDVVANGNIVGSKKAYETIGGSTSTASNIIYAEYSAATQYFKTLTLPGMGKINVLIDPEFYSQIISYTQTGKQLTYDPVYNTELQCFEIEPGRVFMAQMDKAGAISYSAWGNLDTSPIIHRKEYQSLLQAKQGMNALVTQQQPIIDLKNYKDQLETTAGQIQQLAGLYSQTPGDESLSNAIIQDLTKPGGLKKKLEGLKDMITENGKYLSLIAELRRNTSGVYDRYEQELHQMETMLASLPQFVEQLDGLLNYSIWENADSRAIKEFAIMVVAVVGGVLLAIASGGLASGVSAMVISAAAGTAGGMIASRVGQEFFANTTDTGGLTNDLHSDIGKCMLGQAKWGDVLPRVGMEFAQGTATTLMFMGAGRIIGQQLEKFVTANAGNTSWEVRLAYKTRKAVSKLNDNEIQLLDKKGFGKFIAKVGGELKEEFGQEGVQQGADKVDSRLGGLVSIITSITGKTQYRAGKVDVFIEGSEKIAGFESPATVVSYKGEAGEFQGLIANNLKESGYILHSSNNGELIYVRTVNGKPEALKFAPTFESTTIKEIDLAEHAKLYGIRFLQENTQADKDGNYHYDYTDFEVGKNNLMNYLARNGMVLDGLIAEDGSFVVIAKNGERVIFTKRDLVAEQLEIKKQKLDTEVSEAQESQLDPNRDREKVKQNMDAKNASRAEIQRVCLSLGIDFDALDPEVKKQVYNLINKVHKRVGNDYDGAIGESGDIGVLQITKDGIRAKILALRGLKQLLNIDDNLTSRLTKALMREGICGATNNDQSVDIDPEADEMIGVETDAIMTEIESELTQAEATQTPLPEGKDSLLVAKLSKIVVNLSSLIKKIGISPKLIQVVQRKVVEMVQLIHRIQSRSPGWAERNLSGPATQEFIQLLAKNYGVLGIAVATVAVIANWIYNRLDATLHISLDPKKNRIILSVDAYGRKVYADAEGNDLPIETAWRLHNMHDQAVHKICGGSDYVVKGSFHVTTARMLPSDRDVSRPPAAINKMTDSLIDEDGQVIANPSLNGQDIQNVKFRDKSGGDFPTEIKPPFNKQTLHDLSEKGLLKISCDVTMQDAATGANATLEHEFFAENGSGVFDILDSDGNPIGGLIVVDGVNHGSIFAADKYNRALIMSDIKQLTQGDTQDKGKLAKRIANYLQVKGTANRQLIPDRILSHTPQFITVRLEKYGWIINSKTAYEKLRNELLADEDLGLDEHVIPSREDIQQTKKRKPITEPYFVTTVRDIQKRVLAGDITPQREIDAMLGENGFDFTSLAGIGYIVQLKLLQQICSDKRQSTMQQLDDQAPVMEYETAINDLLKKESITDQEKIVIENGPFKKLWDEFTNNPKGEKFKSRTNRLQIAQDLLAQSGEAIQLIDENGNPTEQARQIIFAHLIESNLGTVKYLKQAGFTDKQILVLCDNKVCGMDMTDINVQSPVQFTQQEYESNRNEMDELTSKNDFDGIKSKVTIFMIDKFGSHFFIDNQFAQDFARIYTNDSLTADQKQIQFDFMRTWYANRLKQLGENTEMIQEIEDQVHREQFVDVFMKGGLSGKVRIEGDWENGKITVKEAYDQYTEYGFELSADGSAMHGKLGDILRKVFEKNEIYREKYPFIIEQIKIFEDIVVTYDEVYDETTDDNKIVGASYDPVTHAIDLNIIPSEDNLQAFVLHEATHAFLFYKILAYGTRTGRDLLQSKHFGDNAQIQTDNVLTEQEIEAMDALYNTYIEYVNAVEQAHKNNGLTDEEYKEISYSTTDFHEFICELVSNVNVKSFMQDKMIKGQEFEGLNSFQKAILYLTKLFGMSNLVNYQRETNGAEMLSLVDSKFQDLFSSVAQQDMTILSDWFADAKNAQKIYQEFEVSYSEFIKTLFGDDIPRKGDQFNNLGFLHSYIRAPTYGMSVEELRQYNERLNALVPRLSNLDVQQRLDLLASLPTLFPGATIAGPQDYEHLLQHLERLSKDYHVQETLDKDFNGLVSMIFSDDIPKDGEQIKLLRDYIKGYTEGMNNDQIEQYGKRLKEISLRMFHMSEAERLGMLNSLGTEFPNRESAGPHDYERFLQYLDAQSNTAYLRWLYGDNATGNGNAPVETDIQTRSQERQVATQAKEKLFMENKQNRDGMTPLGAEYALQEERQRTMSEAERVLGFVPSAEQQEVIRQAHMVGYGEADVNGNIIGVDPEIKYTQGQKVIKARIMKESGLFSDAEIRELGNQGVIGFADRFAAAINRFVEPIINGFNEKGEVMQNGSIYNDVIIGKKRQFRLSTQDKDYITLFVGADGNLRIESPANRLFVKANERYDIGTSSPSSGVRNAFGFSDEVPGVMMKVKFDGQKISIQGLEGHTEYVGSLPFDPLAIVENQASGPLILDGQELSEGAVLYPHNGGAPVTVQTVESDSVTILNADGTTTEYLPDAVSDYFTIHTNPEPEPDPVTNSPDNPLVRSEDGGVIQKGMWYEMPVGTMESIGDQPFAFQLIEDRIAVRVGPAEWLPGKDKDGNIVYQFDKGQNIPSLRRVDEQTGAVRWLHIIYSEDGRVFAQYIKMEAQSQIPIETAPVPLAVETQKPNSADLRQYPYQESSGPLYGQKGEWSNGSEIKFTDENGTDRVYQVVIRDGMYYVKELDRRGRLGDERSLSKAELNELGERHGSHPELDKIQFEAVPSRRPNRLTQHQEVPQVRRDANVVSIFDTYGNLDACKSNLRSQGCTDANGNWIGGNTVLTMHGDILGDRFKGGLATYRYLAQLKSQAQMQGGDVVILLGNHEFSFIAYLMNEGQVLFDDDGVSEQFEGIYDLAEFNEGHTPGVEDGGDILENMKNDRQGLFDLNFIAGAQIFEYVDDTLQVHANPNQYIIHTLIRASTRPDGTIDLGYGVDAINAYLQNGLKQFLLGENHNIDKEEFTTFMLYLTDMNTERVSTYSPEHYRILHDAGVNRITHGHSLGKEVLPNTHQSKHYDIEIIDGDREHGFPGSDVGDQNRNALTIDRGGSVFVGWNQDGQ